MYRVTELKRKPESPPRKRRGNGVRICLFSRIFAVKWRNAPQRLRGGLSGSRGLLLLIQ